jgi:hypothetical protein
MKSVQESAANDNCSEGELGELTRALQKVLDRSTVAEGSFAEQEDFVLAAVNEATRRVLEQRLQDVEDRFGRDVKIGGLLYRRHQPGNVVYFSLCGPLRLRRWTYRPVGERNGPTKVAIEVWAGLIEGATPALAFALAQGFAKAPIRSVEKDLLSARRVPPSRSTMDRMAKAIGAQVKLCGERIERVVREQEELPDEVIAVNVGLDRTTVPMEEVEEGRRVVRYRMAYVGTVCFTNTQAEPVQTRRYAVPAHCGPNGIVRRMLADIRHGLQQRPGLNVGIVQDGAPELWGILWEAFRADPILQKVKRRETYDFYHFIEYLGRVLEVLANGAEEKQQMLTLWRSDLLSDDRTIDRIIRWIDQRVATFGHDSYKFYSYVRVIGTYLFRRQSFRYSSLKKLGLMKGSGVTEGACKSMITMRAKRSGQRWQPKGISSLFALKSVVDSERFPAFWALFAQRYIATCEAA